MPVILCADDFGLSLGVSESILNLIEARRVSATSAIVTGEVWPHLAGALAAVADRAAIGLHLNLTFGSPLGPMPKLAPFGRFPTVTSLIGGASIGTLALDEIENEIVCQFDRFEQCLGRPPDFVDGHEHVQVLPGIRRALLGVIGSRFGSGQFLLRDPSDRLTSILRRPSPFKAMVVGALAANFGQAVQRAGFLTNWSFAGFYSFDRNVSFGREFRRFLLCASVRHLVMCHPGLDRGEAAVPHAARRAEEYRYLMECADLPGIIWHPDRRPTGSTRTSIFHDLHSASGNGGKRA